jgi:DNA polymerase-3 subunit delta'
MWREIIGHEREVAQLQRVIAGGLVPHAFLFAGIAGIGKRLVAETAARALLCDAPLTGASPCGRCENCAAAVRRNHPDILEIAPDGIQITIEAVREAARTLSFRPYQARRRTIIIDGAELMNASAANSALKMLEEPPPDNHFFLITSMPTKLLPTILSRCQKIAFSPLGAREIKAYLVDKLGWEEGDAGVASAFSGGSIGNALSIRPSLVTGVCSEVYDLLRSPDAKKAFELSSRWASDEENIGGILYILHKCWHDAHSVAAAGRQFQRTGVECFDRLLDIVLKKNGTAALDGGCKKIGRFHNYINTTFNKQLMFDELLLGLGAHGG